MTNLTFNIIARILFGTDLDPLAPLAYEQANGKLDQLPLRQFYLQVTLDTIANGYTTTNSLFPVLQKLNIGRENRRTQRNISTLRNTIWNFIVNSKNKDSVFSSLRSYYTDDKLLLDDTLFLLFAGHETSSHTLTTAVFRLLKHPECRARLLSDISALRGDRSVEQLSLSQINEVEYLHWFIKECLRIDTPVRRSFTRVTKKRLSINGVDIPAGFSLAVNFRGAHYNEDEWVNPFEFRPERFDPDSSLFNNANGKLRHPLSFLAFLSGKRNCLGQTLALAEIKTIEAKPFLY